MSASDIVIKGAREHNLRAVDLVLPRDKLICLTGVSGSGKSSLAFDTLYAEGQRRYVESLSSFARQFLGQMPKPDVDFIGGLRPSISISQKSTGNNPRSTVGTITEIYDYLRVLFARVGVGHCTECGKPIAAQTRDEIIARIMQLPGKSRLMILAPLVRGQKGEYRDLCEDLLKQGFVRARIDGEVMSLGEQPQLDRQLRHDIEVVVDRIVVQPNARTRVAEAVELALKMGHGTLLVNVETPDAGEANQKRPESGKGGRRRRGAASRPGDIVYSADYACADCGISFEPPSPQMFSFNSPQGMCLECDGLGQLYSFDPGLLVPDDKLSFKKGCFELIGRWRELGRWRRHIYQGVADTIERLKGLPEGTMLETPWRDLKSALRKIWLWGTGGTHITFTWRGGSSPIKYGGTFEGIIPELLSKYRNAKSKPKLRQLEKYMSTMRCPSCDGSRLNAQARAITIQTANSSFKGGQEKSLPEFCQLAVSDAAQFFQDLALDETRAVIAAEAVKEIRARLGFLLNVGLDYLTLERTAPTLSGGESQRIRLAGQIGSGLVGVLYILDEPSIGLHPRDNNRLLDTLSRLRDMGNTVVVVEHDEDTMRAADHIIDFGPGPGVRGGEVVVSGSVNQVLREKRSVTGRYLAGKLEIKIPPTRRPGGEHHLKVIGAAHNNLKNVDVEIPLSSFVCVTGVSGSGKSSLVNDILVEALRRDLNRGEGDPGLHERIEGLEHLDKLIAIDQSPIGRTPRSNPGTYIKVFDDIRNLFSQLTESKRRGYKPGRFSFNVKGGRCEACEGNGSNRLEMDFLADVWVTCPVCAGHRYNYETLQVRFKDKSIAEVLEMDVQQALELFENIPKVNHKLQTLHDVGLDYLKLGQPSPTLSGGEAQRIKLARELVKKSTGQTLYLLDEPTTGLHFADIQMLLEVLHDFVDAGNTVLVVEHNLDVIKTADWIIDLGPEGGEGGGKIVATGTPEEIAGAKNSHTGKELAAVLGSNGDAAKGGGRAAANRRGKPSSRNGRYAKKLRVHGAAQHNLKSVDAELARDKMTVFCGPSGSGKTSLAMDTIYAEGQRRYVESLSAYARQFVDQMEKPKLDHIEGLSPAIAIEQKNLGNTPRSTVGTVTEVYDYLRILMARLGTPFCPTCDLPIGTQTVDEIVDKIMDEAEGTKLYLMAPLEIEVGGSYEALWEELKSKGYVRVRVDGKTHPLDEAPTIDRRRRHRVEVVIDRISVKPRLRSRIAESVENALAVGLGVVHVAYPNDDLPEPRWSTRAHSQHLVCEKCSRSFEPLTPHNFSFNSHLGWCESCEGLGTQRGANPAALIRDPKLSLAEGAVLLWPDLNHTVSRLMLEALGHETGLRIDVPFDQLNARERRLVMHGSGEEWFEVRSQRSEGRSQRSEVRGQKSKGRGQKSEGRGQCAEKGPLLFRFQFKGLYPALEEASRLSPSFRGRLERFVDEVECTSCDGSRLRDDASAVQFRSMTIGDLCRLPLGEFQRTLKRWKLDARQRRIAGELLREIKNRVQFLNDVGLEYLTLGRAANTLSNGEAQRIRLASQLGSGLCGVLYVLDEPTIGLHPRDNRRLLKALHRLRDLGNTLLVVEHDHDVIAESDYACDFGPAAGKNGGEIVAHGTPKQIVKRRTSVTGPYLSGKKAIPIPANRRLKRVDATGSAAQSSRASKDGNPAVQIVHAFNNMPVDWLIVVGARHNNLRGVDVRFPLGALTVVTGVSGCGKSSLVDDVMYRALARKLHRAATVPGPHDEIRGIEQINKVIRVDQQPLGNSPSSNPATYTGVFELIRQLFAQLPEAKVRGYTARRFSFNVPGGRCEACEGNGQQCIEMHFLPDVWVQCDTCRGQRYNPETLAVTYHGRSVSDVLDMTCGEAVKLFENIPKIRKILQTLVDVGLDYLTLGQPAPTLSGGEAQRVKLAAELARPDTGSTLYLLDEPTTGLHFDDLRKLLDVLNRLVDLGNSVILIEHNLDIIKSADWIIDMGPEAGDEGGEVVVAGIPEEVAAYADKCKVGRIANPSAGSTDGLPICPTHTGQALAPLLEDALYEERPIFDPHAADREKPDDRDISEVGRDAKMPWEIDGRGWHTRDRVDRKGEPCRWDGRILSRVVDRIQELGQFSETNWNARSVVEIAAEKKTDGWFFHAITGETWLLKLKFRVTKGTFKRQNLIERIPLKSLNEVDELPVYGNEPRVKCRSARGPWQEVELRVYRLEEIDTPEFWRFVAEAVAGFQRFTDKVAERPEDHMPWKKLGQKWHFMRKGFPPGRRIRWDAEVLEELCELLSDIAPDGQFLWNNQQLVHLYVKGQREPWATLQTKRPDSLNLFLNGPKGAVTLGRIADLAHTRDLDATRENRDVVRLSFRTAEDLHKGDLADFLNEHLQAVQKNGSGIE